MGGKRRLLPRLRPLLQIAGLSLYCEPFVGGGAAYLDLRARGYEGPAVLADANPEVAMYWKLVHHADTGFALIEAAEQLPMIATVADFERLAENQCEHPIERNAIFWWLTNLAWGNRPPLYRGGKWQVAPSKLRVASKYGQTFPWRPCVERLKKIVRGLMGKPIRVEADFRDALRNLPTESVIYADPPYRGVEGYALDQRIDYVGPLAQIGRDRTVILSERTRLALPGWSSTAAPLRNRLGHRETCELIYCSARLR